MHTFMLGVRMYIHTLPMLRYSKFSTLLHKHLSIEFIQSYRHNLTSCFATARLWVGLGGEHWSRDSKVKGSINTHWGHKKKRTFPSQQLCADLLLECPAPVFI